MNSQTIAKTLAITSLVALGATACANNPYQADSMSSGHKTGKMANAKCGSGSCGAKKADGSCGDHKMKDGSCGGDHKMKDGKCGEGKCGAK